MCDIKTEKEGKKHEKYTEKNHQRRCVHKQVLQYLVESGRDASVGKERKVNSEEGTSQREEGKNNK